MICHLNPTITKHYSMLYVEALYCSHGRTTFYHLMCDHEISQHHITSYHIYHTLPQPLSWLSAPLTTKHGEWACITIPMIILRTQKNFLWFACEFVSKMICLANRNLWLSGWVAVWFFSLYMVSLQVFVQYLVVHCDLCDSVTLLLDKDLHNMFYIMFLYVLISMECCDL